jgi:hypothetical protein
VKTRLLLSAHASCHIVDMTSFQRQTVGYRISDHEVRQGGFLWVRALDAITWIAFPNIQKKKNEEKKIYP